MGGAFQQVEGELRNPEPEHAGLRSLLAEKELKIQQVKYMSLLPETNLVTLTSYRWIL